MLFQGQEFWASTPFFYFADHEPDLAELVRKGRREFMLQYPSLADPGAQALLPRPDAVDTFEASKLDWAEADVRSDIVELHRDLPRAAPV